MDALKKQFLESFMLGTLFIELPLHLLCFGSSQRRGIRHGENIVKVNHIADILFDRF